MTKRPDFWPESWPSFEPGKKYVLGLAHPSTLYCIGYDLFGIPTVQFKGGGVRIMSKKFVSNFENHYCAEYIPPRTLKVYIPILEEEYPCRGERIHMCSERFSDLKDAKSSKWTGRRVIGVAKIDWSEDQPFPLE